MLKPGSNPFYVLLVVIGVAFCITACAYGVMTVKKLHPLEPSQAKTADQSFVDVIDRYGFPVMMIELGLLAFTTFAAIGTDEYWSRPSKTTEVARSTPKTSSSKSPNQDPP